jgi:hypothetical protein
MQIFGKYAPVMSSCTFSRLFDARGLFGVEVWEEDDIVRVLLVPAGDGDVGGEGWGSDSRSSGVGRVWLSLRASVVWDVVGPWTLRNRSFVKSLGLAISGGGIDSGCMGGSLAVWKASWK